MYIHRYITYYIPLYRQVPNLTCARACVSRSIQCIIKDNNINNNNNNHNIANGINSFGCVEGLKLLVQWGRVNIFSRLTDRIGAAATNRSAAQLVRPVGNASAAGFRYIYLYYIIIIYLCYILGNVTRKIFHETQTR